MQARGAKDPTCRRLARLALAGLPRGGGDGDAIRLGILNIMREHGIREGHRPVGLIVRRCLERVGAMSKLPVGSGCCGA